MRRLVLPIKIDDRNEQPARFQDPVNLVQRPGNVLVVIERFHGKRLGKLIVTERQLLGAGYFVIDVRKRRGGFTREINHLVRDVYARYAPLVSKTRQQTARPARSASDIQHARISWDAHEFDCLLANRAMASFHALALAGAGPFIEFGAELFLCVVSHRIRPQRHGDTEKGSSKLKARSQ